MTVVELNSSINVERSEFAVMGNTAHITVVGGSHQHLEYAHDRLSQLEQLWSRFLVSSQITQLNNAQAKPVLVNQETITLIKYMIAGYQLTNGAFDPTLLPALVASGYDTSRVNSFHITLLPGGAKINQPIDLIQIDEANYSVQLPKGMTLDPGAIGKGLAADLVATEIMNQGVHGVCVNVGGDVRCIGEGDIDGRWIIGIESPFDAGQIVKRVKIQDGAVATSNLRAKVWSHHGTLKHHVINPKTGLPCSVSGGQPIQVSVVARECVWAEVFATALLVDGEKANFASIDASNLAALMIRDDGRVVQSFDWAGFDDE